MILLSGRGMALEDVAQDRSTIYLILFSQPRIATGTAVVEGAAARENY